MTPPDATARIPSPSGKPASTRYVWVALFIVAATLYIATANRGPQWQDFGLQQLRIVTGQIENARGLALTHPLQYYLGRAAIRLPFVEPAFAITLISSLAGAIAVANLATIIHLLTQRLSATLIATAALMLSHTFWQHATHTESYTLTAALLTTEWLCVTAYALRGRPVFLLLLGLANGLGLANHLLALLATPVDVVVVILALRRKHLTLRAAAAVVLLWVWGTLPYTMLVVSSAATTGNIAETLRSALFGRYADAVLNVHFVPRTLMLAAAYVAYNFPGLTVLLALLGIHTAWTRLAAPRWLARALLAELLIYAVFVSRYAIVDQYTFFFPVYLLLALFAGVGLARLVARPSNAFRSGVVTLAALTAIGTPIVYLSTASILRSRGLLAHLVKNKPYRDGYRAFFVPWGLGANFGAELNAAVRELAGNDGLVLIEDHMQSFGLRYALATGDLPASVTLQTIPAHGAEQNAAARLALVANYFAAGYPVVLVPVDRDNPGAAISGASWERCGDIYRLLSLNIPPVDVSTPPH